MLVFVKVVESGSISAASRAGGQTPSAVSKQVGLLEEHVGHRLLHRTRTGVSLTAEGRDYYEKCKALARSFEAAEAHIQGLAGPPKGMLRVISSVAFGKSQLVPALPAFQLQRAISTMIRDLDYDYWTGTVYTTNRRVWEHDDEFKEYLRKTRCMAIDMETATIFSAGFANALPAGALLLVSDQPMVPDGVKTEASDKKVSEQFVDAHIRVGIEALKLIRRHGKSVKHLRFEE